MAGAPTAYIEGSFRGHKAIPGEYNLTLRVGNEVRKTSFKILPNPKYNVSAQQYEEYHAFMTEMETQFNSMHRYVNDLQKIQNQVQTVLKEINGKERFKDLHQQGEALQKKLNAWDEDMIQRKSKAYDDVENYPNKFTANVLFVINQTESDIPRVNKPSREVYQELMKEWSGLESRAKELLEKDVPSFSRKLWDAGVGAVGLPK